MADERTTVPREILEYRVRTWRYRVFARCAHSEPITETEIVNATVEAEHETTAYLMAHNMYWPPAPICDSGFLSELREEIAHDP